MKIVDARSFEDCTHTGHLLTKVSLLNVNNILGLCLLNEIINKYDVEKTETESIY